MSIATAKKPKFKLGKLQKAWLKALESGSYKYAKGCLHREDLDGNHFYDCLGVACDILVKKKVIPIQVKERNGFYSYDGFEGNLSSRIYKAFGLRDGLGGLSRKLIDKKDQVDKEDFLSEYFEDTTYEGRVSLSVINDERCSYEEDFEFIIEFIIKLIKSEPELIFEKSL